VGRLRLGLLRHHVPRLRMRLLRDHLPRLSVGLFQDLRRRRQLDPRLRLSLDAVILVYLLWVRLYHMGSLVGATVALSHLSQLSANSGVHVHSRKPFFCYDHFFYSSRSNTACDVFHDFVFFCFFSFPDFFQFCFRVFSDFVSYCFRCFSDVWTT
jgi:hypothetical protein